MFIWKHLWWNLFFIKLQTFRPADLLKRDSKTWVFLLPNFSETPILKNILTKWLFETLFLNSRFQNNPIILQKYQSVSTPSFKRNLNYLYCLCFSVCKICSRQISVIYKSCKQCVFLVINQRNGFVATSALGQFGCLQLKCCKLIVTATNVAYLFTNIYVYISHIESMWNHMQNKDLVMLMIFIKERCCQETRASFWKLSHAGLKVLASVRLLRVPTVSSLAFLNQNL